MIEVAPNNVAESVRKKKKTNLKSHYEFTSSVKTRMS